MKSQSRKANSKPTRPNRKPSEPERLIAPAPKFGFGHLALALALVGAAVFAGWDAWVDIWTYAWNDEESSQILLVPIVVAWLIWVRRGRLAGVTPTGAVPGLIMLGLGWAMMAVSYRQRIQTTWHGGAVMMVVGAAAVATGWGLMRRLLPAVIVLLFLIPVPAAGRRWLAIPLQTWTAQMTQGLCDVLGMGVERSGNLLIVNGTNVAVAEACNGMRMVFTLFLVCYTFTFVTPLKAGARATVLILSPVVAMAANIIRLVPTVYVFGNYSKEAGERFHEIGGWVMLVVGYFLLAGVLGLLRWMMIPVDATRPALAGSGGLT